MKITSTITSTANKETPVGVSSPAPQAPIKVTSSSGAHNSNTTTSFHIPHIEASVINATEPSKNEAAQLTAQIAETIQKLAPFFPELTEENKNQIFFLDEEDHVTLGSNEMETFNVADLASEASHEAAKEQFIKHLTEFYDKEVTDLLYPEEERKQPLTALRAVEIQHRFFQLQKSVLDSCQGDLSKYETQLRIQLDLLKQVEATLATPPQPTTEQFAVIDSISKYTGLPPSAVYAGMLTGGLLAASAAGVALLPLAFHSTTLAALSHGSALSAALVASPPHAATTAATAMAHTAAGGTAHNAAVGAGIGIGGTVGAVGGGVIGHIINPAFHHDRPPAFAAGMFLGGWIGMGIGAATATYGPALFHSLLSSLSSMTLGSATTTAATLVTGTVLGAAAGGVYASSQDEPTQGQVIQSMMIGAGTGGIISGLSLAFGAVPLGHSAAMTGGVIRGLRGIVAGRERGPQGAIQEGMRGAALGIATGGGVTLFGGLCSGLAHLITAGAIDPSLEALRSYETAVAMAGGGLAVNRSLRQEPFDGDAGQAEYLAQENEQVAALIPNDFNRVPVAVEVERVP